MENNPVYRCIAEILHDSIVKTQFCHYMETENGGPETARAGNIYTFPTKEMEKTEAPDTREESISELVTEITAIYEIRLEHGKDTFIHMTANFRLNNPITENTRNFAQFTRYLLIYELLETMSPRTTH